MTPFRIFRASFDGSLKPRDRRWARFAAALVTTTAIVAVAGGSVALLHFSSERLTELANAELAGDVRVLGADVSAGKPCEEQTWPYIDKKCLTVAKPGSETARGVSKQGLGSSVPASKPAAAKVDVQSVGSTTAIAPTPPVREMAAGTTGSAPAPDTEDQGQARTADTDIPLPRARPEQVDLASASEPAIPEETIRRDAALDSRPVSRRESRRLQREERRKQIRLDREARQEVREAERRVRDERRAERDISARNGQRIVKRWTEYTYSSGDGPARRVIVIRRGSLDDDFFRTIR